MVPFLSFQIFQTFQIYPYLQKKSSPFFMNLRGKFNFGGRLVKIKLEVRPAFFTDFKWDLRHFQVNIFFLDFSHGAR